MLYDESGSASCNFVQGQQYSLYLTKNYIFAVGENDDSLLRVDSVSPGEYLILRTSIDGNTPFSPSDDQTQYFYTNSTE
jgi:hypothetical protein